ncbi:S8 family peptidase [Streptomyces microflavus]|uniref:S8 family peptidase n=1 Tax=Streptomyces microflavus TaxID=1919 RepID=UPI0033AFB390
MTTRSKLVLAAGITAALAFSGQIAWADAAPTAPEPAPLIKSAHAVSGEYIVTLDKTVADPAAAAKKLGVKPTFVYSKALHGFAVPLNPLELTAVRNTPGVRSVEEDATISTTPTPSTRPARRAPTALWNLDRIDQQTWDKTNGTGDGQFTTTNTGAGVTAYVLDTGIEYGHDEFSGGRAAFGYDAMPDAATQQGADCNGHGTHVAGTVGGRTYGVAPQTSLVSVRVLDCEGEGTLSGLIAGFDWVAKNARQPAVLNGSLGGDKSEALNNAATALSDAGVLPVIAAGNDARDACAVSPASADRVFTVGATSRYDEESDFSNYGTCLELYAPGSAILSAKLGGGSIALDGTSMAAPQAAGVAALYKQAHPAALPETIAEYLSEESTKDVLTVSKTSPNALLFTNGL